VRYAINGLLTTFSNILLRQEHRLTGLYGAVSNRLHRPLNIDIVTAFFQADGNTPWKSDCWKITLSGLNIVPDIAFISLNDTPSGLLEELLLAAMTSATANSVLLSCSSKVMYSDSHTRLALDCAAD
jgi:hypothetical protein